MKLKNVPVASNFIILSVIIVLLSGCPQVNQTGPKDSILGTWRAVEIVQNGNKVESIANYFHLTEGGFWSYQWKKSNPFETNRAPETLEDYRTIVNSYQCAFGTYSVNGDTMNLVGEFDLQPQYTNNKLSMTYTLKGDTLVLNTRNMRSVYVRQP